MEKVNDKQVMFVKHYLTSYNATDAARKAGYAHPEPTGSRLLRNVKVSAMIEAEQQKICKKLDLDAEMILQELKNIGMANISDYMHWNDSGVSLEDSGKLTREQTSAISEVNYHFGENTGQVKLKMHDKIKALEKLGNHLGLFKEQQTINIRMPDYAEMLRANGIKVRKEVNDDE